MIILFTILMILIGMYFHFEPSLDETKEGDIILWYNTDRRTKHRKFIKLW